MKKKYVKLFKDRRGYTIAGIIGVIFVLIIISSVVVGIISSTLRGAAKAKILTSVSQNGQYTTAVLSNIIEDSRNITQINGTDIDDCTNNPSSDTGPTPTPSGGKPSITLLRMDGGRTVISCTAGGAIASNGASLINTNSVLASNCSFSCSQLVQDPYSVPVININFTLTQANAGASESNSSLNFNTSTSLRVYSP